MPKPCNKTRTDARQVSFSHPRVERQLQPMRSAAKSIGCGHRKVDIIPVIRSWMLCTHHNVLICRHIASSVGDGRLDSENWMTPASGCRVQVAGAIGSCMDLSKQVFAGQLAPQRIRGWGHHPIPGMELLALASLLAWLRTTPPFQLTPCPSAVSKPYTPGWPNEVWCSLSAIALLPSTRRYPTNPLPLV